MAKTGRKTKLTPKQQRFVQEYLIDPNATKAYAIAYGVSEAQANKNGPRLMVNDGIKAAVEEGQQKVAKDAGLTATRVLAELAKIVFFDPRKLLNEEGNLRPLRELDDDTAGAIAGIDIVENYNFGAEGEDRRLSSHTKKYKISDKKGAIDTAMKHLGIAGTEKHEHDFTGLSDSERADRIAAILEAARSRRA